MASTLVRVCVAVVFLWSCLLAPASARIQSLRIESDTRKHFFIEQFGFFEGGEITLKLQDMNLEWLGKSRDGLVYRLGFLISAADKDPYAFLDAAENRCLLDISQQSYVLTWTGADAVKTLGSKVVKFGNKDYIHRFLKHEASLYSIFFAMCDEGSEERTHVTFTLDLQLLNPGPNYLSAGETPLPVIYTVVTGFFLVASVVWTYVMVKKKENFHKIHILMCILLALKLITVSLEAARWHILKLTGHNSALDYAYYVFTSLRGMMLFLVILLIGTGWSLLKPFLSGREKKVVIICLVLQVLDNIAMVIIDESIPGDRGWFKWQDIFKLLDIICCCAILFPIVWSIRHLREASQSDGKAAKNLQRLKLFRHLYLTVVSYVYFTRIILPLLEPTLPYALGWIKDFLFELVTLSFFIIVGYKFRPAAENPYLPVHDDDEELMEEQGTGMLDYA